MPQADTAGDTSMLDDLFTDVKKSIENVKQAAQFTAGIFDAGAKSAQGAAGAASGAYSDAAKQATVAGQAQGTIDTLTAAAQQKQKDDDSVVAQSLQTDPVSMARRGIEISQAMANTVAAQKEYNTYNDASIFDNPLDWVKAQFLQPAAQSRLEDAQALQDRLTGNLATSQKLATQGAALDVSLDAAAGTAFGAAKAQLDAANAKQVADQELAKAAAMNLEGIKTATAMSGQELDVNYKNMQATQTLFGDQRELIASKSDAIKNNIMIDQRETALEEKQANDAKLLTANNLTGGAAPANMQEFQKLPSQAKPAAVDYANYAPYGSYGPDPVTNYNNVTKLLPVPAASAGEAITRTFVGNSIASAPIPAQGIQGSTPQEKAAAMINMQKGAVGASINNALKDVSIPGTPYTAPNIGTVLKLPMVAANDLGKALATQGPDTPLTGDTFMATALGLAATGKTPGEIATQITAAAKQLQGATNAAMGLRRMGLPEFATPGSPAQGYNMSYTSNGSNFTAGGRKIIDWSNQAQVESAITREIAAQKYGLGRTLGIDSPAY